MQDVSNPPLLNATDFCFLCTSMETKLFRCVSVCHSNVSQSFDQFKSNRNISKFKSYLSEMSSFLTLLSESEERESDGMSEFFN